MVNEERATLASLWWALRAWAGRRLAVKAFGRTPFHVSLPLRKWAAAMLLPALASCGVGGYEEGTGENSLLTADFVEAHTDGQCRIDYALADGGDSLALSPAAAAAWASTPDTLYRALLYYDRADGQAVRPRSIAALPVLKVAPTADFAPMKTDPVDFESAWVSASGRYLNIGFYVKTGEASDGSARQTVGMACDSVAVAPGGIAVAHLRLYHDQGGVPEYYSSKTYVSVSRRAIAADSVSLTIETYGGTVTRGLRLPPSE